MPVVEPTSAIATLPTAGIAMLACATATIQRKAFSAPCLIPRSVLQVRRRQAAADAAVSAIDADRCQRSLRLLLFAGAQRHGFGRFAIASMLDTPRVRTHVIGTARPPSARDDA